MRDREAVEATAWAVAFRTHCPTGYAAALAHALQVNERFILFQDTENEDWRWVIAPASDPEFWMGAYASRPAAIALCNQMGWEFDEHC